jgi:hypothetical protein
MTTHRFGLLHHKLTLAPGCICMFLATIFCIVAPQEEYTLAQEGQQPLPTLRRPLKDIPLENLFPPEILREMLRNSLPPKGITGAGWTFLEPTMTGQPCNDADNIRAWLDDLEKYRKELAAELAKQAPELEANRARLQRDLNANFDQAVRSSPIAAELLKMAATQKQQFLQARDECRELQKFALQNALATFNSRFGRFMEDESEKAKQVLKQKEEFKKQCAEILVRNAPLIQANEQRIDQLREKQLGFQGRSLGPYEEGQFRALERELTDLITQTENLKRDVALAGGIVGTSVTGRDVESYKRQNAVSVARAQQRLEFHESRIRTNKERIQANQDQIDAHSQKWAYFIRGNAISQGELERFAREDQSMTALAQENKLLESQNTKANYLVDGYRHVLSGTGQTYSWTTAVSHETLLAMQADLADAAFVGLPGGDPPQGDKQSPQAESPAQRKQRLEAERQAWEQKNREDRELATKVAAEMFLGIDPAILTSHNPDAILVEMMPELKAERMDQLARMYQQMADDMDGAVRDLLEWSVEALKPLKQQIRDIDDRLLGYQSRIKQLDEAHAAWSRAHLGNQRLCRVWHILSEKLIIDYSKNTKLTPGQLPPMNLKAGQLLTAVAGSWKSKEYRDEAQQHGTFEVSCGGKLHGEIRGTPPAKNVWSLWNSDTGLVVTFEPNLGKGYGPSQNVFSLGGLMKDNGGKPLEGGGEWYGPGRLTVFCPAPGGSGPLTGSQFEQGYSGKVLVTEVYPSRPASAGTLLGHGDRLQTEPWGEFLASTPFSKVWFGPNTDVTLHLKSEGQLRNRFEMFAGRARINETLIPDTTLGTELTLQLNGADDKQPGPTFTITPRGTDYEAEHRGNRATVRVFGGSVSITDSANKTLELNAGESVDLPDGVPVKFDASRDPGLLINGLPASEVIVDNGVPEFAGSTAPELDAEGGLTDGWVWQDPGHDAQLESPEPGELRITVPSGNEFWGGDGSAPRLLRKVHGDFDLECELLQECAGRHFAISEFVVFAPGSYIGQFAGQSDDRLMAHYRLLGGGWMRSQNANKLPLFGRPLQECPDAPKIPVRFRLSRRENLFTTAWSLDGKTWNLSNRVLLNLEDSIWTGMLFKRMAADGLHDQPAINTLRNLRLQSDVVLPAAEWHFSRKNGEATWDESTNTVRLALDGAQSGNVTAIYERPLEGDVDVVVRYEIEHWQHAAGQSRELSVGLSALDDRHMVYGGFYQHDSERGCARRTDLQINGGWSRYQKQIIPAPPASGYLRVVRRANVFTTFHWSEGAWQVLKEFGTGFPQPVLLTVRIANDGQAAQPAPLTASFQIEQMLSGEIAGKAPGWLPLDLNVFAEVDVPESLQLPENLSARMWESPYPLGRIVREREGNVDILSSATDRAKLVRIDGAGASRVVREGPALAGRNGKAAVWDGDDLLLSADYYPDGGSPLGGIYRVHPKGTFDKLDLKPSFSDLGDLINGPEQTWFFSDFGKDQVYRLERTSAQPTPLITSGDIPSGLLDLAWHETAGKLYALNVAGDFPFGGLSAVHAVERGEATLVQQAVEGVPFVSMDASPGGPLGPHLFVLDSRGKLAYLNERDQLITVLRGLKDFRHIRFSSQGDLYCIGGTDNRFVLRIERSRFDRSPVPQMFDLTSRRVITTFPPTQPEPLPPAQRAKAYTGIDTTDVNTPEARALGVTARHGAVIRKVYPNSPAAAAGLQAGHVVIGCAGREIRTRGELTAVFQEGRPGQKYMLDVQSGQAFLNYELTLGVWPKKFAPTP